MRALTFSLILSLLSLSSLAQPEERIEIASLNRQLIRKKDTVYRFYAVLPEHPVRIYPDRTYYWFHSDTILNTVGGYDGRLLDGSYTVFYPDKNLAEAGEFADGLPNGEWRAWYPGGMIKSIVHWRTGLRIGTFTEFDRNGSKFREGNYRNDELSGKIREYSSDGTFKVIKYIDGKPKEKKAKKEKAKDEKPKNSKARVDQPAKKPKKKQKDYNDDQ